MAQSDWHTTDGQRSLQVGAAAEARLFNKLVKQDADAEWKSINPSNYFIGHDMVFKGLKVEVKSCSGVSGNGTHYETACIELVTKAGKEVGWRTGGADILIQIDRSNWKAHVYDAVALNEWSKKQRTFESYDAQCMRMEWQCKPAGHIKTVQL